MCCSDASQGGTCCKVVDNVCATKLSLIFNILSIIFSSGFMIWFLIVTLGMQIVLSVADAFTTDGTTPLFEGFHLAVNIGRIVLVSMFIGFCVPTCCAGNAKGMKNSIIYQVINVALGIVVIIICAGSHKDVDTYQSECLKENTEYLGEDYAAQYCQENTDAINKLYEIFYTCMIIPIVLCVISSALMYVSKGAFEEAEKKNMAGNGGVQMTGVMANPV